MTTAKLSPGCNRWQVGDTTKHPPWDVAFLSRLLAANFLAFTGPGGLFGGRSESRAVVVVHRGRGVKWEIVFRDNDSDIIATTTTNLSDATESALAWLRGETLAVETDSLHAVVR